MGAHSALTLKVSSSEFKAHKRSNSLLSSACRRSNRTSSLLPQTHLGVVRLPSRASHGAVVDKTCHLRVARVHLTVAKQIQPHATQWNKGLLQQNFGKGGFSDWRNYRSALDCCYNLCSGAFISSGNCNTQCNPVIVSHHRAALSHLQAHQAACKIHGAACKHRSMCFWT